MSLPQKIRIVTWNCQGGPFNECLPEITKLNPDIAVIQEINKPKEQNKNCIWVCGKVPFKGVAIVTFNGYSLNPILRDPKAPDVFVPVKIVGPIKLNLMALWTQDEFNYVRSIVPALSTYYKDLITDPLVVLGDFNSDVNLDQKSFPRSHHDKMVEYCAKEFGLVSSYHKKMKLDYGSELHPTFYMNRKKDKPWHFDYCFVPDTWVIEKVTVGSHEDWADVSDHCPLIVDLLITDSGKISEKNIIKPGKERFCADFVLTGNIPFPESARQLIKNVEERNAQIRINK